MVGSMAMTDNRFFKTIFKAFIIFSFSSFKQFLELDPQLRDVITQFYQSKYASCLKTLDGMVRILTVNTLANSLMLLSAGILALSIYSRCHTTNIYSVCMVLSTVEL